MKSLRSAAALALALVAALVVAADYEGPRSFQAKEILKPSEIKGPHYAVAANVPTDGFFHDFSLTTDYGNLEVESRSLLVTRIDEVRALAELDKVSKSEVFLKAAGTSVVNVGKGVASAVKDPGATAKGMGEGVKRFGTNLGRKAKRTTDKAVDSATNKDEKPAGEENSTEQKAEGVANSVLGVNGAARRWAQKVGANPYTSNPVLKKALIDIGRVDSAGGLAAKIVVPIPPVVSSTATVGNLVWAKDPEALLKENEAKFRAAGVSGDTIKQLYLAKGFTLTLHTRLAEAVSKVNVPGVAAYVDTAAEADSEREALFFVESVEQLSRFHAKQPVAAVLTDSRALVAKTKTGWTVVMLPVDYVRWTAFFEKAVGELEQRGKAELGATGFELQLAGIASELAKKELAARKWKLVEHVPTTADLLKASATKAAPKK
jgi:hypothetical protein